jgi:hypothetical protein
LRRNGRGQGEEIAQMMGNHTSHLAQVRKENQEQAAAEQSQNAGEAEEGTPPEQFEQVDESDLDSLVGYYRVINPVQLRWAGTQFLQCSISTCPVKAGPTWTEIHPCKPWTATH